MQKYLTKTVKEYIFIIFTATILFSFSFTKSFGEENIFIVNKVEIEGNIDLNFSRDKYINAAIKESFQMLMSKILVSSDLDKLKNIKLKKAKSLVKNFQIIEERYRKKKYYGSFKIFYNDKKVKEFLVLKNISFSQPKKIKAIFFPVLFVQDEVLSFNENFFYQNWLKNENKNELIDFILPIEDLDDFSKIQKSKDEIEKIDIGEIIKKYDQKNYVFVFMYYENNIIRTYIKSNLNEETISKNTFYKISNIKNENEMSIILGDLKIKIIDIWKESNFVNLLMPLSIKVKYKHSDIKKLNKLKKVLHEINLVENYYLEEFDIENSFFKIYYFGNPKKLSSELLRFGYELRDAQDSWELIYR